MLVTDTHWGGEEEANGGEGNGAEDDCEDFIACAKSFNPDYIFHIGDITDRGTDAQFTQAKKGFSDIIRSTNADRIWAIPGGSHDGLTDYGEAEEKQWKMGFYRILDQPSQWYTLKIGNNVFVFCGFFSQLESWGTPYNYGADNSTDKAKLMNQNKVDWLDRTLAKWQGTGNNIFILYHLPLYDTNVYSKAWSGNSARLVYEHTLIKDIISKYTDVVAWFNGHVHIDPDEFADGLGSCVSGASRPDLPDQMHFIYCGDIWWEHGRAAK